MTLMISLPEELERELRARAQSTGKDLNTLVLEAVRDRFAPRSFREIFAPIHEALQGSSEAELDELFDEARNEVWQQKQGGTIKDNPA